MWKKSITHPRLEVSPTGEIRTYHGGHRRYVKKKLRRDKDGYLMVGIRNQEGVGTTARAHRMVAEVYIPNPENKPVVNHLNGIKDDNRVENLRWSTIAENTQHGYDVLGVQSAKARPVELYIGGKFYSEYQSIKRLSEILGIHRDGFKKLSKESEGYFKVRNIEKFSEGNKPLWKEEFRLNTRGNYFRIGGAYYDKVSDFEKEFNRQKSTLYRWLKEGHPNGEIVTVVSCKELLENAPNRLW